jgi:hypothetical protein
MAVSEEARFIALGPEIGSRIQSRELVLLSYMALSGSLLSAALTNPNRVEFALAIPYLALASALIGMHHDLMLGVISNFMRELSRTAEGPRWHHDPDFLPRALRSRTIRDVGDGFFKLFSVGAALWVTYPQLVRTSRTLFTVLWWGGLASGFGICIVVVMTWGVRNERRFARWFWK